MFFDAGGEPISLAEWSQLLGDRQYRELARTRVGDFEVITVWLGIDQSDGGRGLGVGRTDPPLIFGTIGYNMTTKEYLDHLEVFAATAEQALVNHAKLAEEARGPEAPLQEQSSEFSLLLGWATLLHEFAEEDLQ